MDHHITAFPSIDRTNTLHTHTRSNAQRRFAKTSAGAKALHTNVLGGALGTNQHGSRAAEHEIGDRRRVAGRAHEATVRERLREFIVTNKINNQTK